MNRHSIKSIEKSDGFRRFSAIIPGGGYHWEIPNDFLPVYYFDLFNTFFKLENALRLYVFAVLKTSLGSDWPSIILQKRGDLEESIEKVTGDRINLRFKYIGEFKDNPFLYLTLTELSKIITRSSARELFATVFIDSLDIWQKKFEELSATRNSLAHFRAISRRDIDRTNLIIDDLNSIISPDFINYFSTEYDSISSGSNNIQSIELISHFLEKDLSRIKFHFQENTSRRIIKVIMEIIPETTGILHSDVVENYFINFITLNIPSFYKKLSILLPHLTYFVMPIDIRPIRTPDERWGAEMENLSVSFFLPSNRDLKLFASDLNDITTDIEKHMKEKKTSKDSLAKWLVCEISGTEKTDYGVDLEEEDAIKEKYLEDWTSLSFGGKHFLDFNSFPWINHPIKCEPR